MRRRASLLLTSLLLASTIGPWARAAEARKIEPLGLALQRLVRANYAEFNACYRPLLAQDRTRGGTVFIELEAGRAGRIVAAKAARDELQHAGLTSCLAAVCRRWSLPALEAGAKAVVPLTFRADPKQFLVQSADLWRYGAKKRALLAGAANTGVRRARLEQLRISRSAVLEIPAAALGLIVEGRGRISGQKAGRGKALRAGEVVALRAGRALFTASKPLRLLLVSPVGAGPAGAFRSRRLGRWRGPKSFQYRSRGKSLFVGVVALRAPQTLSARAHLTEDTLFYALEGRGELRVDGRSALLTPGGAVGIAARRRYTLRATPHLRVLVVFAPSGPERSLRRQGLLRPSL